MFRLRWRVGSYPDDEHCYLHVKLMLEHLWGLLGQKQDWSETVYLDEHGALWDYMNPGDAEKAIEHYLRNDDEPV